MIRDFNYEQKLYEIEDSPEINGYILAHLLYRLNTCSIEQLAISFYLYRFPNIAIKILELKNAPYRTIAEINNYEIFNLDILLMPLISEKYNNRFKSGFKQLLSFSLIITQKNEISLNFSNLNHISHDFETLHSNLVTKINLATVIIRTYDTQTLNSLITKIVGEQNNG